MHTPSSARRPPRNEGGRGEQDQSHEGGRGSTHKLAELVTIVELSVSVVCVRVSLVVEVVEVVLVVVSVVLVVLVVEVVEVSSLEVVVVLVVLVVVVVGSVGVVVVVVDETGGMGVVDAGGEAGLESVEKSEEKSLLEEDEDEDEGGIYSLVGVEGFRVVVVCDGGASEVDIVPVRGQSFDSSQVRRKEGSRQGNLRVLVRRLIENVGS